MAAVPPSARPGSRLAGRYLLQAGSGGLDPASGGLPEAGRTGTWQAHDELLNRRVSVRVLPADDPQAERVVQVARRASMLGDPRFLAILDAAESDGLVYIVSEWVEGATLPHLLGAGPLSEAQARRVVGEVARGLAVAHAAGLAHRRLVPEAVLVTEDGQVKVVGLGIDAALHGEDPDVDDTARAADLRSAGALLYAALTGRWPALAGVPASRTLGPAPVSEGAPCSPRQVRAAVPAALDEVTCRALGAPARRAGVPFAGAGELADVLLGTAGTATGLLPVVADEGGVPMLATRDGGGSSRRIGGAVAGALLLTGIGLLGWQLAVASSDPVAPGTTASPTPSRSSTSPTPTVPPGTPLKIASITTFDPPPQGNGEENGDRADRAIDDSPTTAWRTKTYYRTDFGGLKSGVGVVLDLGRPVKVTTVTLHLEGRGTGVEMRLPPHPAGPPPASLAGWSSPVASAKELYSVVTLRPEQAVTTRYVLIWLTALPPIGDAKWRGGIADIEVRT